MKIAIIVCAYNNIVLNKECIASIRKYTTHSQYAIFFVNDGSDDGTREWAEAEAEYRPDDFILVDRKKNKGYVASAIDGMGATNSYSPEFVFMLNNDVVIKDHWVDNILEFFSDPKVALVGAFGHKILNGKDRGFVSGSRMMIRKKIVDKVGFYDPHFKFGYWEDVDLSYRMKKAGYKIVKHVIPSLHLKGRSFNKRKDRTKIFNMNKAYLEEKIKREEHDGA